MLLLFPTHNLQDFLNLFLTYLPMLVLTHSSQSLQIYELFDNATVGELPYHTQAPDSSHTRASFPQLLGLLSTQTEAVGSAAVSLR